MSSAQLSNQIRTLLTTYRTSPISLLSPTIWKSITTTLTNEVICDINLDPQQLFQIIFDTIQLTLTTPLCNEELISNQSDHKSIQTSISLPTARLTLQPSHIHIIFKLCEVLFSTRFESSFSPQPSLLLDLLIKLYELYINTFGSFFIYGPAYLSILLDYLQLIWNVWHLKMEKWVLPATTTTSASLTSSTVINTNSFGIHGNRIIFDTLLNKVVKLHAHLFSLVLSYLQLASSSTHLQDQFKFIPQTTNPVLPYQPQCIQQLEQSSVPSSIQNNTTDDNSSTPPSFSPFHPFFSSFHSFIQHEQHIHGFSSNQITPHFSTSKASSHFVSQYQHQLFNGLNSEHQSIYQNAYDRMYSYIISPQHLDTNVIPETMQYMATIAINQYQLLHNTSSSAAMVSMTSKLPSPEHKLQPGQYLQLNTSTDTYRSLLSSISLLHSIFTSISLLHIFYIDSTAILTQELNLFYNHVILHGNQVLPSSYQLPTSIDSNVVPNSVEFKVKHQFDSFSPPIAFSQFCPMLLIDSLPVVNTTLQLISLPTTISDAIIKTIDSVNNTSVSNPVTTTPSPQPSYIKYAQNSSKRPYPFETLTTFLRACFCVPNVISSSNNSSTIHNPQFFTLKEHIQLYEPQYIPTETFPLSTPSSSPQNVSLTTVSPSKTTIQAYKPSKHFPVEFAYQFFPFWSDIMLSAIRYYYELVFESILNTAHDTSLISRPHTNSSTSTNLFSLQAQKSGSNTTAFDDGYRRAHHRSPEDELALIVQEVYRNTKDHLFLIETTLTMISLAMHTTKTPILHLQCLKNDFTTRYVVPDNKNKLLQITTRQDSTMKDVSKQLIPAPSSLTPSNNKDDKKDKKDRKDKKDADKQDIPVDSFGHNDTESHILTNSTEITSYYNLLEHLPQTILSTQLCNLNTIFTYVIIGNNVYSASKDKSLAFFSLLQSIVVNLAYALTTSTFKHAFHYPTYTPTSKDKKYIKNIQSFKQAQLLTSSLVSDDSKETSISSLFPALSNLVELNHSYTHTLSYLTSLEHNSYLHLNFEEQDKKKELEQVYFQSLSFSSSTSPSTSKLTLAGTSALAKQSQGVHKVGLVSNTGIVLANDIVTKYIGSTTDHSLYSQIYQLILSIYNNTYYSNHIGTYGHQHTRYGSYINPFFSSFSLLGEHINLSGVLNPSCPELFSSSSSTTFPYEFTSNITAELDANELFTILHKRSQFTKFCTNILPMLLLSLLKLSPDVSTNTLPLYILIPTYLNELTLHQQQLASTFHTKHIQSPSSFLSSSLSPHFTFDNLQITLKRYTSTLLTTYCQLRQPQTLYRAYFLTSSILLFPQSIPTLSRSTTIPIEYQPTFSMNTVEFHLPRAEIEQFSLALSNSILQQCINALITLTTYQQDQLFAGIDIILALSKCETKIPKDSPFRSQWYDSSFNQSSVLCKLPPQNEMINIDLNSIKTNHLCTLLNTISPFLNSTSFQQCHLTTTITSTFQQLSQYVSITHLEIDKYLPLLQSAQNILYKTTLLENLRQYITLALFNAISFPSIEDLKSSKTSKRSRTPMVDSPPRQTIAPSTNTMLSLHTDPYVLLIRSALQSPSANPTFNMIWKNSTQSIALSPINSFPIQSTSPNINTTIYPLTILISLCRTIKLFIQRAQEPVKIPTHIIFPAPLLSTIFFQPQFSLDLSQNNTPDLYQAFFSQFLSSTDFDIVLPSFLQQLISKVTKFVQSLTDQNQNYKKFTAVLPLQDISSIAIIADVYTQRCATQSYCELQHRGLLRYGFNKIIAQYDRKGKKGDKDNLLYIKLQNYFSDASVVQSYFNQYVSSLQVDAKDAKKNQDSKNDLSPSTNADEQCGHITLIKSFINLLLSLLTVLKIHDNSVSGQTITPSSIAAQLIDLIAKLVESSSPLFINIYHTISSCQCYYHTNAPFHFESTMKLLTTLMSELILSPHHQIYTAIIQLVPLFDWIPLILPQLSLCLISNMTKVYLTSPTSPTLEISSNNGDFNIDSNNSKKRSKTSKTSKKGRTEKEDKNDDDEYVSLISSPFSNNSPFNSQQYNYALPFFNELTTAIDVISSHQQQKPSATSLLSLWSTFSTTKTNLSTITTQSGAIQSLAPYQAFDQFLCFFSNLPQHFYHHLLSSQYRTHSIFFLSSLFMMQDVFFTTFHFNVNDGIIDTPNIPNTSPLQHLFTTFLHHTQNITNAIISTTFPTYNKTSKITVPFTPLSAQFLNLAFEIVTNDSSKICLDDLPQKLSKKSSSVPTTTVAQSPLAFLFYFISGSRSVFFEQLVTNALISIKSLPSDSFATASSLYTTSFTNSKKHQKIISSLQIDLTTNETIAKDTLTTVNAKSTSTLLIPHVVLSSLLSQLNLTLSTSVLLLHTFVQTFCNIVSMSVTLSKDSQISTFASDLFPTLLSIVIPQSSSLLECIYQDIHQTNINNDMNDNNNNIATYKSLDNFIVSLSTLTLLYKHASDHQVQPKHTESAVKLFRDPRLFQILAYLLISHQYSLFSKLLSTFQIISLLTIVDPLTGSMIPILNYYVTGDNIQALSQINQQKEEFSYLSILPSPLRFVCLLTIFIRYLQIQRQEYLYLQFNELPYNSQEISSTITCVQQSIITTVTQLIQTNSTITTPYIVPESGKSTEPLAIATVGSNMLALFILSLSTRFFSLNTPIQQFQYHIINSSTLWNNLDDRFSQNNNVNFIDSLLTATFITPSQPYIDPTFEYQQFITLISATLIKALYNAVFHQEMGAFQSIEWYAANKLSENENYTQNDSEEELDDGANASKASKSSKLPLKIQNVTLKGGVSLAQNRIICFQPLTNILSAYTCGYKDRKISSIVFSTQKPMLTLFNTSISSLLAYIPQPFTTPGNTSYATSSQMIQSSTHLSSSTTSHSLTTPITIIQPSQYQLQAILIQSTQTCIITMLEIIALISKPTTQATKCIPYPLLVTIIDILVLFNPYLTHQYHALPALKSTPSPSTSLSITQFQTHTSSNTPVITQYQSHTPTIVLDFVLHIFPMYTTILTHLPPHFVALPNNNNNVNHLSTPFQQQIVTYTTQLLAPALCFIFASTNYLNNRASSYIAQLSRIYTPATHPILTSTQNFHTKQLAMSNAAIHHYTKVLISISYLGAKKCIPYLILPMFNTYLTQYSLYSSQIVITLTQSISFALSIILASIRIPKSSTALHYFTTRAQNELTDIDFIPTDLTTLGQFLDPVAKNVLHQMIKTAANFRFHR